MAERVRNRQEWQLAHAMWQADRVLAAGWWLVLVLRGVLPAVFAIAMGLLIGAVQSGATLTGPLIVMGSVFIGLQVLTPIHAALGANLGSRTAAWLYDQLTVSCVRPPGIGHLEDPELTKDLSMARDFDLGHTGPPLDIGLGFIASGLVEFLTGAVSAVVLTVYCWWGGLLLAFGWLGTQRLLRESGIWKDRNTDEVREAQRHAEYAYRLAVDPPAAKEIRLFGLSDWTVERFAARRRRLFDLQWEATRLRERSVVWSMLLVAVTNAVVFWALAGRATSGALDLGQIVVAAQVAIGTSMLAFGGLSWALDGAAAPAAAVARLREPMQSAGTLVRTDKERTAEGVPATEICFRGVCFRYPAGGGRVLDGVDLVIPAGSSLAIVGQNGAGKTTLAKLLCRLYDPDAGSIEIDGADLRDLDVAAWRSRVTAVFQDFMRLELSLRANVAPEGAADEDIRAALADAGADDLAELDTVLARGYDGGTDLSGGQWQRVALARALCAVRRGAGVVLLDEPTAQLDVRGESVIFERLLAATRHCTTILVSHRFSTVRHADRICVLEGGRVVELGTHEELMDFGGRYRTMFDLQATRFATEEEAELDVLT